MVPIGTTLGTSTGKWMYFCLKRKSLTTAGSIGLTAAGSSAPSGARLTVDLTCDASKFLPTTTTTSALGVVLRKTAGAGPMSASKSAICNLFAAVLARLLV